MASVLNRAGVLDVIIFIESNKNWQCLIKVKKKKAWELEGRVECILMFLIEQNKS